MAIDSAEKRRAIAGIPSVPFGPNVTPDATPGQAWRQEVAWSYPGILAGSPVVVTPIIIYLRAENAPTLDLDAEYANPVDMRAEYAPTLDLEAENS
jgi:hypothetical protein